MSTPTGPLHLGGRSQSVPGGWMFKIDALSVRAPKLAWVTATTFDDLVGEVAKRCKANGLDAPSEQEVENQICQRLPPGYCRDEFGRPVRTPGSLAVTLTEVIQGTRTLFGWFLHGGVSDEEATRRSYICNACPENRPISGCSGCAMHSLHQVMNAIVVKPLPMDATLHACSICRCSLKAKVRMKTDDILPHMSEAQKNALPDACWLVAGSAGGANSILA